MKKRFGPADHLKKFGFEAFNRVYLKIPKYQNTKIPKYQNTKIPKYNQFITTYNQFKPFITSYNQLMS